MIFFFIFFLISYKDCKGRFLKYILSFYTILLLDKYNSAFF